MSRRFISGVLIMLMMFLLFTDTALAASLLKVGSRGNDVKNMQQKLIELGYLQGRADGIFGPATREAVIRFQRAKGLSADGIAGPKTLDALYGSKPPVSSNPPSGNNPPGDGNPPAGNQPIPTALIRLGSRGEDVRRLQNRLNELGFSCGHADGIFGRGTQGAVINYQKSNNLAADGIAGPATLKKLFDQAPPSTEKPPAEKPPAENPPVENPPTPQPPAIPITQVLRRGSRGEQVKTLQSKLNQLGYNAGAADGIFGIGTENAVKAFQSANGLSADGIVGAKTIEKMYSSTPPTPPKPDEPNKEFEEFHGIPGQLSGKTVILDPGHGGWDPGANRAGVLEKNLNLDMANRLKRMLEEAGAKVVMTRTIDSYYSLYYRSALANKYIMDTHLRKETEKKDAMVRQQQEKSQEKQQKEMEKQGKLIRVEELKRLLTEKKALDIQIAGEIRSLTNNKLVREQDWMMKKSKYDQKLVQQQQALKELESLKNELKAQTQKKQQLESELQTLILQKGELDSQYQSLTSNIAAAEGKLAGLKKQIDDPNTNEEVKKQLQQQYNTEKQKLDSLLAQAASVDQSRKQLMVGIEQKEAQVLTINGEIAIIQGNISNQERKLEALNSELNVAGIETKEAEDALKAIESQLKSKELDAEILKREIETMENELPSTYSSIQQLEREIPALEQDILLLNTEIIQAVSTINDLRIRGELFSNYLNNPQIERREGIYEASYDAGRNKNHANQELVKVFELTRAHYENEMIFIAIHCNSTDSDTTTASGIQVYYRDNGPKSSWGTYGVNTEYYQNYNAGKRERLARSLLNNVTANTSFSGRYSSPYTVDFSVLRETNLVSALIEVGFINNPADRALLTQEQTRENAAKGMYKGIVEYFR